MILESALAALVAGSFFGLAGFARGMAVGISQGADSMRPDIASARVAGEAEGFERGHGEGWKNCFEACRGQMDAAKTVAQTALDSANAARAATVQRAEMVDLLIENRGVGRALKEGFADIAARVDLMDGDLRIIYAGFEDAQIIRRRNDPNIGRQHGESVLGDKPPPLPTREPRQN